MARPLGPMPDISPTHPSIMPIPEAGCWLWIGAQQGTGYGHFRRGTQNYLTHRAAWKQYRGQIPEGMFVLHKCDIRNCCNPDHLFIGTHADNMRDMRSKGRTNYPKAAMTRVARGIHRGGRHPLARLTEEQAGEILASDSPAEDLALRYGVARATVQDIRARRTWRHLGVQDNAK